MPICLLADMPEGTARGFTLFNDGAKNDGDGAPRQRLDIIIWRRDEDEADEDGRDDETAPAQNLRGFVNKCPHLGLPLETFPDRFLDALGSSLICSAHGAQFNAQGHCFAGPCQGKNLIDISLRIEMRDGAAFIMMDTKMDAHA